VQPIIAGPVTPGHLAADVELVSSEQPGDERERYVSPQAVTVTVSRFPENTTSGKVARSTRGFSEPATPSPENRPHRASSVGWLFPMGGEHLPCAHGSAGKGEAGGHKNLALWVVSVPVPRAVRIAVTPEKFSAAG